MPIEAWLWLVGGVALIGVELLTGTFVLVMLGAGALAAGAVAAVLNPPALVDVAVFAVVSLVLLFGVRPAVRRRLYVELEQSNNDPTGQTALVIHRVDRDSGQVKISGELWSARSLENDRVFEPGDRVTVMQLSGVTAVVSSEL